MLHNILPLPVVYEGKKEASICKEESACSLAASDDTALKIEFARGGAVRRRRLRPVPLPAPSLRVPYNPCAIL